MKNFSFVGALVALLIQLVSLAPESAAEVYLTKTEALDLILGPDSAQSYDPKVPTAKLFQDLKRANLISARPKQFHFFKATKNDKLTGYALIDVEVGKHLPITYIVGFSPAGQITRVEMMVFREIRGWEARERRFMQQFEEKRLGDQLRLGDNIRNVSGATLSSRAINKGVKRALFLWNHFYGKK